jgi:hypothetical protein
VDLSSGSPHPTADTAQAFLAGALENERANHFERHLDACAVCRRALSEQVRARRGDPSTTPTDQLAAPRALPVELGELIDGRYRIDGLIGIGGMGCVFRAHHLHLNHGVAIKLMLPELANDANAVTRFMREARAASRLQTEHVGRVLELGTLLSGAPYLVMELLIGESVADRLGREGPFAPALAVQVVRQVILALREAHGLGIVHRDLKPSNLFIARTPDGREVVKVLDFGIAKSVHPEIEAGLERSSQRMLVGSPLYMAPEQLTAGMTPTQAIDVWALGSTFYELLTGRPPYDEFRGSLVDLMYAITHRPHPALEQAQPGLAPALIAAVDGCLEKKPHFRSTLEALQAALERLDAEGLVAKKVVSAARAPRWRSPLAVAAAAVTLGGVLAAGATLGMSFTQTPASAASAPSVVIVPPPPTPAVKVLERVDAPTAEPQPRPRKKPMHDATLGQLDQRR